MNDIKGIIDGVIYPQPGFQLTKALQGGMTATGVYTITTRSFKKELFATGKPIRAINPDASDDYLVVESFTKEEQKNGLTYVSVLFRGHPGTEDDPVYTLSGRLIDRPISEHKKWADLSENEQNALGLLLSGDVILTKVGGTHKLARVGERDEIIPVPAAQQITSQEAINFAKRIAAGKTTYRSSAISWTETYQSDKKLRASDINSLSKITNPRGKDLPTVTGSRNWQITDISQNSKSGLFSNSITWELSEEGGHDEFLYKSSGLQ